MQRGFDVIARRMVKKRFHSVRATPGAIDLLASLNTHEGPAVVCMNHPSWWDPITMFLVARQMLSDRSATGPIDMPMLEQFGFFRKVGLFGIDPEHPGALDAMRGYFSQLAESNDRPTMLLTPQGRFTDVREPVRLRPGAAALAADHPGSRVVCLAVEYTFWQDQKPEILLHAAEAEPAGSVAGWHRTITRAFSSATGELAGLSIAQSDSEFQHPMPWLRPKTEKPDRADVHPVYNLFLRLRGKSGVVKPRGRSKQ